MENPVETGLNMRLHHPCLHALFLAALCLPYCINLGTSSIWDANEAFYAETPREMLESGDFLAPRFNYAPRTQKPPFTYWAILASYAFFGVNEFAVRLPSALAAMGVVLFAYGIARMLFTPRAAIIAATITATAPRIFILSRRLPIDIFLLFFLMGVLFFIVRGILGGKIRSWVFAYLFAGFAFLTKGPIALLIPGLSCLLWALCGRRPILRDAHPMLGAAILIVVILPWYVAIYLTHGWMYIEPFFFRDNIGRFASEVLGPSRGMFYYFPVAIIDFFPWSFLLLCALFLIWLNRKTERPLKSLMFGLPLIWCACIFLFFSLSKNKQEYYIAPIYPAAAVVLSGVLDKTMKRKIVPGSPLINPGNGDSVEAATAASWESRNSWWIWAYGLLVIFIILLSLLVPYFFRSFMPKIGLVLHYAPSLVLLAGSMLILWNLIRRRPGRCLTAISVSLWIVYMAGAILYLPELEQYRPIKRFCQVIEARLDAVDETGYFRIALPSMVYYLRRPVFEEYDTTRMENRLRSEKRVFCILAEKDYNYFADSKDLDIYILDRHSRFSLRLSTLLNSNNFPGEELLLISNRADRTSQSPKDRLKS